MLVPPYIHTIHDHLFTWYRRKQNEAVRSSVHCAGTVTSSILVPHVDRLVFERCDPSIVVAFGQEPSQLLRRSGVSCSHLIDYPMLGGGIRYVEWLSLALAFSEHLYYRDSKSGELHRVSRVE